MATQPRALTPLFLTELWERFGFYIVQGLLILYMTSYLHFRDSKAYLILGQFTALVYLSPILGGFIADRVLGYRYSILIGATLLGIGYSLVASTHTELLFWGLATVIMGNGFLKPNISSFLGEFYQPVDARRKSGFTIFYMGINIGSMLATLTVGYIQRYLGWHSSFLTAALGMVIAIITFCLGYKTFADKGLPPAAEQLTSRLARSLTNKVIFFIFCLALIILSYGLLKLAYAGNIVFTLLGCLVFILLLVIAYQQEHLHRRRLFALFILFIFSIIFWAEWFQIFFSLNLFVKRSVDRHVFGIVIPPVAFISLEAIFVVLLSPLFSRLWQLLHNRNINIAYSTLFSLSLTLIGIGMGLLAIALQWFDHYGVINPWWVVVLYFLMSCAELLLSPIGLAMVSELAPVNLVGMLMGIWFFTLGLGGSLAGYLAKIASVPKYITAPLLVNQIYQHAFIIYMLIALAFAVILTLLAPLTKRLLAKP